MSTTAQQMRAWQGPAIFLYGFRPFFFAGAVHGALMVALWVPWYLGTIALPSAWPPIVWHSHELLFGYVPAIVAGFLLTAVPNWTGRAPVVGWPLAALFSLWLIGRLAIATSALLPMPIVTLASFAFPLTLIAVLLREIIAGKNWRNLKVVAGVSVLTLGQLVFQIEAARQGASLYGHRLAIAATLMLIMIVGGRIVPSFTINWLKMNNPGPLPAPFGRFDRLVMGVSGIALLGWITAPSLSGLAPLLALMLGLAGLLQCARQARWQPHRTLREPLVTVLHVAHGFVPLGFLLAAGAAWTGETTQGTAALHAWTAGAVGLMTLAVMTRATRGHTGRALTAPPGTVMIYTAIVGATFARIIAAWVPASAPMALAIAGSLWVAGYLAFAILYGPMLLMRPKR